MSNSAAAKEPSMEEILASIRRIISDETDGTAAAPAPEAPAEAAIAAEPMSADPVPEVNEAPAADEGETMSEADLDALFAADDPSDVELTSEEPADDDIMELTEEQFAETAEEVSADELSAPVDDMASMAADPVQDIDFDAIETDMDEVEPSADEFDMAASMDEPEQVTMPEPAAPIAEEVASGSLEALVSAQAEKAVASAFADLSHVVISQQSRTMDQLVQDMLRPMLKDWLDANLPPMVERMVASEIKRLTGR